MRYFYKNFLRVLERSRSPLSRFARSDENGEGEARSLRKFDQPCEFLG